ncbi:MAG: putative chromosome-partitioning protein ParB [Alphaproteobacteria bacterium MarineAlpha5_Bin3]|jgi:ParB family chromosome partitioning protein|nr:MAG: putative chromosome-partitioning protein ParB [Alphaproteobacteria bacterium MarineAlpha5_Bin3]
MNTENKKLGRGLGALLPSGKNKEDKSFKFINVSEIQANLNQPRKNFKKDDLEELALSIKSQGILQPIVVRLLSSNNYKIIAGERRWRAAQLAGIHEIPAFIKEIPEDLLNEAALIENIQRENLNPVEEARAYESILKKHQSNYDELSKIVGKSKSHISNMIRLLELEEEILNYMISGKLSMGHARALIGVPNAKEMANEIINKNLSVRQTEKNTANYKKNKRRQKNKDPNILDLEKELSEKIGLKTSIHFSEQGSSGSLTLYYSDLDQLDDIMKRLKK